MPQVEPTTVININETDKLAVAELPQNIQQMIKVFDEWNQDEADARNKLTQINYGKNVLSNQIIEAIKADLEEKAEADAPAEAPAAPAE